MFSVYKHSNNSTRWKASFADILDALNCMKRWSLATNEEFYLIEHEDGIVSVVSVYKKQQSFGQTVRVKEIVDDSEITSFLNETLIIHNK